MCPFFIRTIIIYTLGREYVGLSTLFVSILSILSLTELGIGTAMVFNLYKPINDGDYEIIAGYLNLYKKIYRIIGLIILCGGLAVMPFLRYLISGDVPSDVNIYILFAIYLANTCLSYFFFAYRSSLLAAYQRTDLVTNASTISVLFLYTIQIIVLLLFKNYYFYIVFLPLSTLLNNFLIYIFSYRLCKTLRDYKSSTIDSYARKELFRNVRAVFGHKLGGVVIYSLDNIVISSVLGLVPLAIFNNYYYVVSAINSIFDIVIASMLASIGNYLVNHDEKDNYTLFLRLSYIIQMAASFCAICMLCLYQDFILLWVGSENMYSSIVVVILFSLYFFSGKFRIMGVTFKDAAGMWQNDFWKPYVGVAINVVFNILLVNLIGTPGALISTIFVFAGVYFPWETVVLFKDLFKTSPKQYLFRTLAIVLLASLISVGIYFISVLINGQSIWGFVLKAAVVGFSTLFMLVLTTFWCDGFKFALQKMIGLFKKK